MLLRSSIYRLDSEKLWATEETARFCRKGIGQRCLLIIITARPLRCLI